MRSNIKNETHNKFTCLNKWIDTLNISLNLWSHSDNAINKKKFSLAIPEVLRTTVGKMQVGLHDGDGKVLRDDSMCHIPEDKNETMPGM